MRKLLHILLLVMLNLFQHLSAQNKIDSLRTLLKTDKEDTNKVIHLNKVCRGYIIIGEFDKGLPYSKQASVLAQSLRFKKGEAQSYNNIGNIFWYQGNYPEALKNHLTALKIREEIKDKQGVAYSYGNIGNVYWTQGNLPEALDSLLSSSKSSALVSILILLKVLFSFG
jgi:tetratricopeptide (TPR) repeat protein